MVSTPWCGVLVIKCFHCRFINAMIHFSVILVFQFGNFEKTIISHVNLIKVSMGLKKALHAPSNYHQNKQRDDHDKFLTNIQSQNSCWSHAVNQRSKTRSSVSKKEKNNVSICLWAICTFPISKINKNKHYCQSTFSL